MKSSLRFWPPRAGAEDAEWRRDERVCLLEVKGASSPPLRNEGSCLLRGAIVCNEVSSLQPKPARLNVFFIKSMLNLYLENWSEWMNKCWIDIRGERR
jgi:hypothetical protein